MTSTLRGSDRSSRLSRTAAPTSSRSRGGNIAVSMSILQIADPRERRLVAPADGLLRVALPPRSLWRPAVLPAPAARILLMRLERIGDLLMVLPAIADLHAVLPDASVDLVVGSWNR